MINKPFGIIYKITCVASGKSYIGITTRDLKSRWKGHIDSARDRREWHRAIAAAIRKYGADQFTMEHIASAFNEEGLCATERELILQENTLSPHGYNLSSGGEGLFEPSQETIERMRNSHLGKKQSPEVIAKRTSWQKGSKRSKESTEKTRLAQLGTKRKSWGKHSEESRKKMAEAAKKRDPSYYAYLKAPEAKAKRAERMRQLWADPTFRRKHASGCKERCNTPQFRSTSSMRMQKLWKSSAHRAKVKAGKAAASKRKNGNQLALEF